MSHWIDVAERLRAVKRAEEEYRMRAWMDRFVIGPMLLDRVAADLDGFSPRGAPFGVGGFQHPPRMDDDNCNGTASDRC